MKGMKKILYTHFPEYFDNKYADGGEMDAPKHWNELSMADKSDAIASAVRNGVTTLEDIRKAWDDYADSGYQEGTHEYLKGGYKPSASIKNRIANWEGSSMQTNRSFDAEAKDFWNAIPSNVRSKLSQQQADALYSYSYNVGAGNFKKRVVPSLERYFNGNGSVEDVQRHMYATGDKDYRGLAKRRAVERALFAGQRVEDVPSFDYDYSSNSSPYGHRFTVNNNFQTAGYLGPIVNGNSVNNDNTNKTNIFLQALEDEPKQTIAESTPEPRYSALERLQNIYSMYGMDDYAQEIGKYNPFASLTFSKGGRIHRYDGNSEDSQQMHINQMPKNPTIYRTAEGGFTTASGHPVEELGWNEDGYMRYRDTVTGDLGTAFEPSEAYTKYLIPPELIAKIQNSGEKPLEAVYPEFDVITTGGLVKDAMKKAASKVAVDISKSVANATAEGAEKVTGYLNRNMGYWGDNLLSRTYGTMARRCGLPTTSKIPETYRALRTVPDVTADGKISLYPTARSNARAAQLGEEVPGGHANFTTDRKVTGHGSTAWQGDDVWIVKGKNLINENTKGAFKSVEPSDMFTEGMPVENRSFNPKDLTVVTGNPETISWANEHGVNIMTDSKLQELYKKSLADESDIFAKDNFSAYEKYQRQLMAKRGRPTKGDYKKLEKLTGLPTGTASKNVEEETMSALKKQQEAGSTTTSLTYPNNRVIGSINKAQRYNAEGDYGNVYYDPATDIEYLYKKWKVDPMGIADKYGEQLKPYLDKWEKFSANSHAYGGKMYDDGGVTSSNGQYHVNPADYWAVLGSAESNRPVEVTLPDVTVKAADPKNYRSSYDPNGFMDFMNAVTLGAGNRFSVSQDARLLKDAYDAATGNKSWKDVFNSAVFGNSGIFDNPYANMALDIVVPTVIGKYRSIANVGRGIANVTAKGAKKVNYLLNDSKQLLSYSRSVANKLINVNPDGTWNMQKIMDDTKNGAKAAQDFLGSTIKKEADAHNIELANRMGYTGFTPFKDAQIRSTYPIKPDFTSLSAGDSALGSIEIGGTGPQDDIMQLNLFGDLDKSAFHETLHRGFYGMPEKKILINTPESNNWYFNTFKPTRKFYAYKQSKLLQPLFPDKSNLEILDYLSKDGEAYTNAMEIGRRMGITPGTPYPGKEKALELFKRFAKSSDDKAEIFNYGYNWKEKPLRIWQAITGRYAIIPVSLGLGAANEALNNNN